MTRRIEAIWPAPLNAIDKISKWGESETALKLSVIRRGQPPNPTIVWIVSIDEEIEQVSFIELDERTTRVLALNGASFRIGRSVLEATQPTGEWMLFEELPEKIPPHRM